MGDMAPEKKRFVAYEAYEKMADEYAKKYKGKLEITRLIGQEAMTKFEEYKLGCVPAVVINEKIRIEGICPSRVTLDNALREGGL